MLLIQGEIDIVKGERVVPRRLRHAAEPLHYDRVLPGRALALEQIAQLERLTLVLRLG